jgi:predicted DNA-binding protein
MSKTVTLRLPEDKYELFKKFAEMDNRAISNFIETATSRYIEEIEYADEFEMAEINSNVELKNSLQRGVTDVKKNRRRLVG